MGEDVTNSVDISLEQSYGMQINDVDGILRSFQEQRLDKSKNLNLIIGLTDECKQLITDIHSAK